MALLPIAALMALQGSTFHQPDVVRPLHLDYLRSAEVVRVSPRPTVASGILMVTTDFDVRVPEGAPYTLNMIYGGEDQFIPPLGSICQIAFIPGEIPADFRTVVPNIVQEIRCDTGTDADYTRNSWRITGARIIGVAPPPVPRPRRTAFTGFDIEAPGRLTRRLYLPYPRGGRALPAAGQTCALTFHWDWVTGPLLGTPRIEGKFVRVVDEIDCETRPAVAG